MPEVNLPPITPHVDPGQTVELTCEATGTPTPRIEWLRDNSALIADGERIIIEGNQLTINNARPSDSGEYMCLAINAAGQASHGIKVTVTENGMLSKLEPSAHMHIFLVLLLYFELFVF